MILYNTTQFYTCWRVQGPGYADAIIGAHASRVLRQAFQGLFTKELREGKRRNQISWWGSTAGKILLMHEVFIEFRQAIIQGIVKCHWMNRLKLWVMGRENSIPEHHLKPSLLEGLHGKQQTCERPEIITSKGNIHTICTAIHSMSVYSPSPKSLHIQLLLRRPFWAVTYKGNKFNETMYYVQPLTRT